MDSMLGLKEMSNTLTRFLAVGIGNTFLGITVIYIGMFFFSPFIANLIGYAVVVPISFILHRTCSFVDKGNFFTSFVLYTVVIFFGYLANLIVLKFLIYMALNAYVAQLFAMGAHVITVFVLSRSVVFRHGNT